MIAFWQAFSPILEAPVGNLFYALLALLLVSSVSVALHNRARPSKLDSRLATGVGALMGLRLIEVAVFAFGWQGNAMAVKASPALERGIALCSLVVIAWLWAEPGRAGRGRQALVALELVGALVFSGLLVYLWLGVPANSSFNYTDLDYAWGAACSAVLVIGLLQILTTQTKAKLGLVHLGLLLGGQAANLLLAPSFGSMPLLTEIAHLVGLPLLFLLPVAAPAVAATPALSDEEVAPAGEAEPAVTVAKPAFFDLEELGESETFLATPQKRKTGPLNSPEELARDIAEKLHANVCVLATLNEAQKQLELQYGYNLLRSAPTEPARIALREVPRLASALQRERSLRLAAEPRLTELGVLSQALRLSFPGHLLATPFSYPQDLRRWAVLVLHIERPWQVDDEVELEREAERLGSRLAQALGISDRKPATEQLVAPVAEELNQALAQLEQLQEENTRYRQDVDRLLSHIDELQSQPVPIVETVASGGELVSALQLENERLRQSLASAAAGQFAPLPIDASQAKEELRLALEEVAVLQTKLDTAQQAMLETSAQQPGAGIPADQVELLASIAQELRQPLSSVLGYTDLLLGESVGLLGALQKKFLERVRNSTERMNKLVDDLIRIAELDRSGYSVQRKPVDLSAVIDDALSLLRQQMQEKRIALRVNLPRLMPKLNTDRDALQQILYHLLQNADAATPAEGAITLRAVVEEQAELGEFVLIQVSDSGGGIPEEDLPRVFSRVYRATNPVVAGVGDSGVGLNIAETLTLALGGRIWVESQPGVGATFSVLLPLEPDSAKPAIG
jgi:signal transduction histidine kinase